MAFDWTIKITDIVMIVALFFGPIVAVQITEYLRKSDDARKRKVHIFRTLMATRSTILANLHVEALNLVELEFDSSKPSERKIIDCWRIYLAHLGDTIYPKESWEARRKDLLIDLLYEMALSLGYLYDKSQIKSGTYYPQGRLDTDNIAVETQKLWLEVLRGQRPLPMQAFQPPTLPPAATPPR